MAIRTADRVSGGDSYDVVVVGGGAAGLSGALTLARARRSVLVVDAGAPRNAPADGVHNYLGREGVPPAELLAAGRAEVASYGGQVISGGVTTLARIDGAGLPPDGGPRFKVGLADGRTVLARRLLVATGLVDELPDVPGLADRWGRDVVHCPYCHGWELRDEPIGILATGPLAVHQALLWRQLTADVVLFRHTTPPLADEQAEQLAARGIRVVDGEVAGLEVTDDRLTGIRLRSGEVVARRAVAVGSRMVSRADLLAPLGLAPAELRLGEFVIGSQIEADPMGATAAPGVWVAGNVASAQAQVLVSAAAGLTAGAAINMDLVTEDTQLAVDAHRKDLVFGPGAWDARHRAHAEAHPGPDRPNPVLVEQIAGLPAGTALDAGAGTGADAGWLADRGWKVTAVDLSPAALEAAARHTARHGHDITWRRADLAAEPAPGTFDLVVSHYLCVPPGPRRTLFANLAAAVAPGGTLLLVGHAPADVDSSTQAGAGHGHGGRHTAPDPHPAEVAWSAPEVASTLGPDWTIEIAETRPVMAHEHHGAATHDSVLRARRSPSAASLTDG
ncbi:bifunctional NAD(P)/FAD-dependent oxidoreductase/class I SAM-dependent methyltransferase [Pseudofrankia inefficax]|uniref:FAD-dependent pyridine nucleotide-disulfide oxidoreductase n=1 Tax=Pseudofrankia inefficax (strain DSM 45817 / CECT 9037 / DDB 130130 / EuI1c) TaxID=298654 RepID=E3JC36_PSEI1|nr:FAD-dependent oxidoreductase [Pseudofrankia inefficax]ADP83492.1 FAD-dependent pyridine nucleotide-disulfide oxidoreductase [Pseudofrankia inefficax]